MVQSSQVLQIGRVDSGQRSKWSKVKQGGYQPILRKWSESAQSMPRFTPVNYGDSACSRVLNTTKVGREIVPAGAKATQEPVSRSKGVSHKEQSDLIIYSQMLKLVFLWHSR